MYNLELDKAVKETDEGWVDYFKDKDISRKAGEEMAKETDKWEDYHTEFISRGKDRTFTQKI